MRNDFVSVVSMESRGLKEDTPLYVVDVLSAQQGTLSTYAQSRFGIGRALCRARQHTMRSRITSHPSSFPSFTVLRNNSWFSGDIICS